MNLGASFRHNLASLLRFSGRDPRWLFWPYAIALFILLTVAAYLLMIPMMFDVMREAFTQAARPPADPAPQIVLPAAAMERWRGMVWPAQLAQLIFALLVAAAVARRLHDRDRTGLWGFLPVPFALLAVVLAPRAFDAFAKPVPDFSSWGVIILNNLALYAALILFIILLAQRGTVGPNRYGEEPGAPPR